MIKKFSKIFLTVVALGMGFLLTQPGTGTWFTKPARAATNYCNDTSVAGCWFMDGTTDGRVYDQSSEGNHLWLGASNVALSTTVPTSPAYSGYSRDFSSSGYLYDEDAEGTALDINGASAKISMTAWIKVTADPGAGTIETIAGKYDATANQRQYLLAIVGAGSSQFSIRGYATASGTVATSVTSTLSTYAINTWYHVVFVSDNTDLRLYVNGSSAATPVAQAGGIYNGTAPFAIGAKQDNAAGYFQFFTGLIDEVAVFSRDLSSTEASDIYNNGLSGDLGASDTEYTGYTVYYDDPTPTIPSPIDTATSAELDALCADNPTWSCVTYGYSAQGRPIEGIVIAPTGYTKTILLDGAMHGGYLPNGRSDAIETFMTRAVLDFLHYLSDNPGKYQDIRWVTAPLLNPDGALVGTRKNNNTTAIDAPTPRAVNLNRNFPTGWGLDNGVDVISTDPSHIDYIGPSASSEPETVVIENIIQTYRPHQHFNGHTPADGLFYTEGMSNANIVEINTSLAANGFTGFATGDSRSPAGKFANYAYANGIESYAYEATGDNDMTQINRYIGAVLALADSDPVYAFGRLGTNDGGSFDTLTANDPGNCYAGTVTSFSGTGPWTWSCSGVGGGTDSASGSASINQYTLTPSASLGGSISPSTARSVNYGANQSFNITANAHYHIADVTVDGSSVGAVSSYTFSTTAANHTISATFAIDTKTLTYTAGDNGSISGTSPQTVDYGASGTEVTAVANDDYEFVNWSDNSTDNPRTDTNVTDDISVTANFEAISQSAETGSSSTTYDSSYGLLIPGETALDSGDSESNAADDNLNDSTDDNTADSSSKKAKTTQTLLAILIPGGLLVVSVFLHLKNR